MGMSDYVREIRGLVGHRLLQMPSVTIINADGAGRLLLVRQRDSGMWVFPGGAIEPGESPADAAVREMWEESGLFVELVSIMGIYGGPEFTIDYPNGDSTSYVMTVFKSRTVGGELGPRDDESTDVGYFVRQEINGAAIAPWVRLILPDIFDPDDGAFFKPASWKPR